MFSQDVRVLHIWVTEAKCFNPSLIALQLTEEEVKKFAFALNKKIIDQFIYMLNVYGTI